MASDFKTSFAEAVIRDMYVGKSSRYISYKRLDSLAIAVIDTSSHVMLLDLRGGKAYEIGMDTDAKGARDHAQGQALSKALHDKTDVDGIVYNSRFTGEECVVVF
ncbi:RES family NAD+ phosphorylase [Novosphingobium rosa]|uniref:RES family NAD+ phosphorylase n=1 Tax=Novosphingobium rosa TaxID=76978 RepID=UPI0038991D3B